MSERCNQCRFWLHVEDAGAGGDDGSGEPYGWGWCRRKPPMIVERMADMLIPSLGNRADNYDPENVATACRVADCSLHPATWHDRWCGDYRSKRDG